MTEYIIKLYVKNAKIPYKVYTDSIEDRSRPRFCGREECFGGKLEMVPKAKIYYAKNGKFVAETYMDKNGNKRLRWKY